MVSAAFRAISIGTWNNMGSPKGQLINNRRVWVDMHQRLEDKGLIPM